MSTLIQILWVVSLWPECCWIFGTHSWFKLLRNGESPRKIQVRLWRKYSWRDTDNCWLLWLPISKSCYSNSQFNSQRYWIYLPLKDFESFPATQIWPKTIIHLVLQVSSCFTWWSIWGERALLTWLFIYIWMVACGSVGMLLRKVRFVYAHISWIGLYLLEIPHYQF